MASQRTITDTDGRVWTCTVVRGTQERRGQDVVVSCTTPSIPEAVTITVGWQWDKMAPKGLARLITAKAA
jgi:hypothetical protein